MYHQKGWENKFEEMNNFLWNVDPNMELSQIHHLVRRHFDCGHFVDFPEFFGNFLIQRYLVGKKYLIVLFPPLIIYYEWIEIH